MLCQRGRGCKKQSKKRRLQELRKEMLAVVFCGIIESMKNKYNQQRYNTPYQLKLQLEISKIIEISDPVYTFNEVFHYIDLKKYLAVKESRTGRKRYDSETLMKVILFAFMEHGYVSVREIEKLCKTDIRFLWLLQDNHEPSHMTIDNLMKDYLVKYHLKSLTRTIAA